MLPALMRPSGSSLWRSSMAGAASIRASVTYTVSLIDIGQHPALASDSTDSYARASHLKQSSRPSWRVRNYVADC